RRRGSDGLRRSRSRRRTVLRPLAPGRRSVSGQAPARACGAAAGGLRARTEDCGRSGLGRIAGTARQGAGKGPEVEPRSVAVFGGVVDPAKLRFPLSRLPASEARDWDAIDEWADQVPAALEPD